MHKYDPKEYDPAIVQQFFDHDYHDRGMIKWQGYMLSDHTSALKKESKQRATVIEPKPLMTAEEIGEVLEQSYANNKRVSLQLYSTSSDRTLEPDKTGKVLGVQDNNVFVDGNDWIAIDTIRHAELI